MRRILVALLTLAAVLVAAAPAPAATVTTERGRQEIDRSRVILGQSLDALERGDRDRAYKLSREAYLDHFEFVEIPLRLRNPNLVIDTEFKYAKLRNDIKDGASVGQVRKDTAVVRAALVDVDRELSKKGLAAPLVAFGFSFSILFREGVEAVLLIAILLGSLAAGAASNYKRPLAIGVGAAVVATGVLFVLATLVIDVAPLSRELLEAVTALIAVVVLIGVSFWLVARLEHKRRMEFMRARVASAMAAGTTAAFVGLGFTAVFSLQEADLLAATPVDHPRLPVFLAELTGIHPTSQGLLIQGVVLGLYVLGALYVFAIQPARRRRVAETATA
jgi:high-affinity iron transporter